MEETPYPKRLIEVDLPIKRISEHARRERSINHGHISTLHIWWARRPLAACRAVICAALWPDPADQHCPQGFRKRAAELITDFACKAVSHSELAGSCAPETWAKWQSLAKPENRLDPAKESHLNILRYALLDFIADFANWDNSTNEFYLETSQALTQVAHEALGGEPGTRPLVVDPFAGGGAIPLEALRVGADAFATDLNPVAVLLNKVVLEYLPKYGTRLADEVRKWGEWVKREANNELAKFYPKDTDGSSPVAYIWARTIICEGPNCGVEVPLIKTTLLDSRIVGKEIWLKVRKNDVEPRINIEVCSTKFKATEKGTVRGWAVTCPACDFTTPKKHVQQQLSVLNGGASSSRLVAVVTSIEGKAGKNFRNPRKHDLMALTEAAKTLEEIGYENIRDSLYTAMPDRSTHRAVGSQLPLYGLTHYDDLYLNRQKLALFCLARAIQKIPKTDFELDKVIRVLMAFCLAKQADYSTTLCRWRPDGAYVNPTLGGEKKYVMVSDFAESCPLSAGSGNWLGQVNWITRFLIRESAIYKCNGQAAQASADQSILPEDVADAMVTDPPYYDSVPYSDLSNFFYVWLRPLLLEYFPDLTKNSVAPKLEEMTVDHPGDETETKKYKEGLAGAFLNGRTVTKPSGVGVIVFAHKSTAGWESLLAAIIQSGWSIVASWPVDTEMQNRLNAKGNASLASSVHIVCRPRENSDGSLRIDNIGDYRDVLHELPLRMHEWMPRLAREGVVGADAIFACLGPALEIFSHYSHVEKVSGEPVTLHEYLEQVWAAISKEALNMIFEGADATGFEADARLTAMWFWTLATGNNTNGDKAKLQSDDSEEFDDDEEQVGKPKKATAGYNLEFDAARKIAQGLGAHLEDLDTVVQVKGDKARLLSVAERSQFLFGKTVDSSKQQSRQNRKRKAQLEMFEGPTIDESESSLSKKITPVAGSTILDHVHQSMLLFAAGRSEALKRFLVEDGVGRDQRFWRLADALSKLYPMNSDEKRWVDGVLARKMGLGF
ncbi:MAG: DUF1156 domain-containing protein [Acidobacteria bacterium]|nr:DUF1156 domain-containing protein [Acidobacteriota bacterium]